MTQPTTEQLARAAALRAHADTLAATAAQWRTAQAKDRPGAAQFAADHDALAAKYRADADLIDRGEDPRPPVAPATVPVTDDQLLEVYLSGGASRLASVLGRSLPAHVAVRAAREHVQAYGAHLLTDPVCRHEVLEALHALLRGTPPPDGRRATCSGWTQDGDRS